MNAAIIVIISILFILGLTYCSLKCLSQRNGIRKPITPLPLYENEQYQTLGD